MSQQTIDCYILPCSPLRLLLPTDCIADVVANPELLEADVLPASWMRGHVNWKNQRLPVLSYLALHNSTAEPEEQQNAHLVVLNPIPHAARKTYSGLLCYGDIEQVSLSSNMQFGEIPEPLDRRYIEAIIEANEEQFVIPKLPALGVAFSYF